MSSSRSNKNPIKAVKQPENDDLFARIVFAIVALVVVPLGVIIMRLMM